MKDNGSIDLKQSIKALKGKKIGLRSLNPGNYYIIIFNFSG